MSGGQTKNAALTTALAFHYQVLIGLEKCFALEEGQCSGQLIPDTVLSFSSAA